MSGGSVSPHSTVPVPPLAETEPQRFKDGGDLLADPARQRVAPGVDMRHPQSATGEPGRPTSVAVDGRRISSGDDSGGGDKGAVNSHVAFAPHLAPYPATGLPAAPSDSRFRVESGDSGALEPQQGLEVDSSPLQRVAPGVDMRAPRPAIGSMGRPASVAVGGRRTGSGGGADWSGSSDSAKGKRRPRVQSANATTLLSAALEREAARKAEAAVRRREREEARKSQAERRAVRRVVALERMVRQREQLLRREEHQVRMERARLLGLAQNQQRRLDAYRAAQSHRRQGHDLPPSLVPYTHGAGPAAAATAAESPGGGSGRQGSGGSPRRSPPQTPPSPPHRRSPHRPGPAHHITQALSHEERHLRGLFATSPLAKAPAGAGSEGAMTDLAPAPAEQSSSSPLPTQQEEQGQWQRAHAQMEVEADDLRHRISLVDRLIEARLRGTAEAENEGEEEEEGARRHVGDTSALAPTAAASPRLQMARRFAATSSPQRGAALARSARETTSRGSMAARMSAMHRRLEAALTRLARADGGGYQVEAEAARVVAPLDEEEEDEEEEEKSERRLSPSQQAGLQGVTALVAQGSAALAVARHHVDQRRRMLLVCILQRLRERRRYLEMARAAGEGRAASQLRAARRAREHVRDEVTRLARELTEAGDACRAEGTRMCNQSEQRVKARQERVESQVELLHAQLRAVSEEVEVLRAAAAATAARGAVRAPAAVRASAKLSPGPVGRGEARKGVPVGRRTVNVASLLDGAL